MGIFRRWEQEPRSTSPPIESVSALVTLLEADSLEALGLQLQRLTGVEERIPLEVRAERLRYELGGEFFDIEFPTSVDKLISQISNAEEDAYDTVSPRGYEDTDLFDEW